VSDSQSVNQLLLRLSKADRALLAPGLAPVELELRQAIETANKSIAHVYFPDSGIISVVVTQNNDQVEAGIVGREGMTATAVVLGNHRSPNDSYVQIAGHAQRMSAKRFREALSASRTLSLVMQRYAHVFMVQLAQTAFANGTASLETRLARWLLMAHDRQDGERLHLTHEFLAVMLSVRRPGVTEAMVELERRRLIAARRGVIQIVNRKGLMKTAGGIYGVPEAEYKRLLG
jgi:CRP-like cAMP-binding protein